MSAYRVDRPPALREALQRAFSAAAPALIEVRVDRKEEVSPWEFLMPASIR